VALRTTPGPSVDPAGADPAVAPSDAAHPITWRPRRVRVGGPPPGAGVRGRRQAALFRIRGPLALRWRISLAVLGLVVVVAAWAAGAVAEDRPSVLPTPLATARAFRALWDGDVLTTDLWASTRRILIGYGISILVGTVLGVAIGTFTSIEAFFEAQIGFLRYVPATALTPVFLLWFGIEETPKVWLIVVGTVFFNILMIADAARAVPRELINASYTLGAGRLTTIRRVIVPWSLPGIFDAARINLAAGWLMLVVAELLAAQEGLGYQIVRAQRFRAVDRIFAILLVFGAIGLLSDLVLRGLRNRTSPWARS
jgi:NitT/TauT family transport system permease protein